MINGWKEKRVSDCCKIHNGGTPNTSNLTYWNGNINWCTPTDITNNNSKYIFSTKKTITDEGVKFTGGILPVDCILLCSRATIGELCINKVPITTNQGFKNLVINQDNDTEFLFYLLKTKKNEMCKLSTGSTFNEISKKSLGDIMLLVPAKKNEQKLIAEYLSDADELIENLERLIDKKKNIKLGTMQELLTGKKRLPGFTKEWKLISINKIGGIYSGLTGKTKKDFGWGNSKYVTFLNVLNNRILKTDIFASVNINESQNFIKYGDILFNTSSETPEEVALCSTLDSEINEDVAINSFCFGFRVFDTKKYYPLFIVDYFRSNSGRKQIIEIAQGSTRYNLSKDYFLNLEIPFPEYDEQKSISDTITDMEKEIHNLEQQLNKYKHIKQGMMEQLLTGKIRLV